MKHNHRRQIYRIEQLPSFAKGTSQWSAAGAADAFARTLDRYVSELPTCADDWAGRAVLGAAKALADLQRTAARVNQPAELRPDLAASLGIVLD